MSRRQAATGLWLWLPCLMLALAGYALFSGSGCSQDGDGGGGGGDDVGGGTSSGAGGSGGTNEMAEVTDSCPPAGKEGWVLLHIGAPKELAGTTRDANDDYSSYCGVGASREGRDVVYSLRTTERGTLTVSMDPQWPQTVAYLESECGVRTTLGLALDKLPCIDKSDEQIRLGVVDDQELYLIVEGHEPSGGFGVTLDLAAPACGDAVINPGAEGAGGEQCDFGDGSSAGGGGSGGAGGGGGSGGAGGAAEPNGCLDNCRFEQAGADDHCPGTPLTPGEPTQGYTVGYSDTYQASCAPSGGPDRVYSVGLNAGDNLHVLVESEFDVVLSLLRACTPLVKLSCHDSPDPTVDETIDWAITDSDTYYIVVDGFDATSWGTFTITATVN